MSRHQCDTDPQQEALLISAAVRLLAILLLAAVGSAVAREKHLIDPTPPGSLNPEPLPLLLNPAAPSTPGKELFAHWDTCLLTALCHCWVRSWSNPCIKRGCWPCICTLYRPYGLEGGDDVALWRRRCRPCSHRRLRTCWCVRESTATAESSSVFWQANKPSSHPESLGAGSAVGDSGRGIGLLRPTGADDDRVDLLPLRRRYR
jgi:hypothetical protein